MSSSPVFHDLFRDKLSEFINLKLKNVKKSAILEILRFAYSDTVNLTNENMFDVLSCAQKFEIKFLIDKTCDFICSNIDEKNIVRILMETENSENLKMKLKCYDYIEKNFKKFYMSDEFPDIERHLLKSVFSTCTLQPNQAKAAGLRWAENQCRKNSKETTSANQMEMLDDMFSDLTFDADDFKKFGVERDAREPSTSKRRQKRHRSKSRSKKVFLIEGELVKKNFFFAGLDILTKQKVFLEEIHFVDDLSEIEQDVEIRVVNVVDDRQIDLFRKKIDISSNLIDGEFKKFVFPEKIALFQDRKIWIKIGFHNPLDRLTLHNHKESDLNDKNYLSLTSYSGKSYAQIIEKLVYS